MPRRREHPLPHVPISVETLPPPEKRTYRLALSLTPAQGAVIERIAEERGEQPAVFCRVVIETALENTAARALADPPDLFAQSPAEQRRRLLELFLP
jgi:hypothetical protein